MSIFGGPNCYGNEYWEYPFETLPELGLSLVDGLEKEAFDLSHARKLTEEEKRIFQSGYLFLQTHINGRIPPPTKASYSEMWFILQAIQQQVRFTVSLKIADMSLAGHDVRYQNAIAFNQDYYYSFEDILHIDFSELSEIIQNCAIFEAGLANLEKRYYNHMTDLQDVDVSRNYLPCGGGRNQHARLR